MNYRLLILVLGTFIIGTDDFVIAGLLPHISNEMNVTIATAGQLVTAFAIAYAIGAPLFGTLMMNLPLKSLLVISMLMFAIANTLSSVVTSYEMLFLTRILAALAAAIFTPLAMTASASLVPDKMRGKWCAELRMHGYNVGGVLYDVNFCMFIFVFCLMNDSVKIKRTNKIIHNGNFLCLGLMIFC
ncbi:MFS transporter [Oceanobacillus sp. AG]|uniref:MFS transporter n=1 Tax=Oceanobacillus sp. AG TaxID=2681969 RepID=UPI0012EC6AAD|nr:MFS transporter [Oceanobacillus sp. AG]